MARQISVIQTPTMMAVPDSVEGNTTGGPDTDSDGTPDFQDTDSDNDGYPRFE